MCDCDLDRPVVWEEAKRKARKQHVCCECDKVINSGEEYIWMKGLWDSRWKTYKMCLGCENLAQYMDIQGCYGIGGLFQDLVDCDRFDWDDETETYSTDDPNLEIISHNPLRVVLKQELAA